MAEPGEQPLDLPGALKAYVAAREAALLVARKTLKIGDVDARALLFIVDHPGTRPSALAEFLQTSSAGVTTLTDRLVRREVVRREVDDSDRRAVRLTATIDLAEEPWSALQEFDERIGAAIAGGDEKAAADAAALLVRVTQHVES